MFTVVGKTQDGKEVISGVYKFFETHGMPLDVLLDLADKGGMLPSWLHFYDEARTAGMKHDRILSKLDPALSDVYGPKFRDYVINKLNETKGGSDGLR